MNRLNLFRFQRKTTFSFKFEYVTEFGAKNRAFKSLTDVHASAQIKLVPAVLLLLLVYSRRRFSKPANVQLASFIPKID